ncbi:MAG TPA: hypothetical protein VGX28_00820 [Frankiaceae bacterium]|jgi:hypothetical protein|nr:hypothetical protein [Frankiaceae bacterium]
MPTLRATAARNAARDTVTPALQKAQGAVTTTVVPAVVTGLTVAKAKGSDLLDSDVALEARRRGSAIVKAAKGETFATTAPSRRWRFGLGMVTIGTGLGFAIAWLMKRLSTPVESYTTGTSTLPVPSGTDGGVTTPVASADGAAPSGTPTNEINLSAGAPTNF